MRRRTCDQHDDVTTTLTVAASSSGTLPDPRDTDADKDEPRTARSALDFIGAYSIIYHRPTCQCSELSDRRFACAFLATSFCWCLAHSCMWWCGHLSWRLRQTVSFSWLLSNADKSADARTLIKLAITHDALLGLVRCWSLPLYCHLHQQFVDYGRMRQAHCLDRSFIRVCSRVTRGMQLFSCSRSCRT